MRTAAFLAAMLVCAGTAVADEPAPATPATPSVIDLQLGRVLPAADTSDPDRPIDLFPADVLGDGQLTFGALGSSGERERRPGLSWDGGWKVHAAQIGLMAAGFAALVGLCGGGRCMIPDAATRVLPDWARAQQPVVPVDRATPTSERVAY